MSHKHEPGPFGSPFKFTGEMMDANDLLYLRARYYSPALGAFTSLDPIESGNRYQYVGGNVVSVVDPSGMVLEDPGYWDTCKDPRPPFECPFNENDVARMAHVARGEAQGVASSSDIIHGGKYFAAVAAITLTMINREARLGQVPYDYDVLKGFGGIYVPKVDYIPQEVGERVYKLVEGLVAGLCSFCDDPLAVFNGCPRDASLMSKYSDFADQFPGVVNILSGLRYVSDNHTIIYEHSFVSDNQNDDLSSVKPGERLGRNMVENVLNQQEEFKHLVIRGFGKSVVVSNDFNPVPFEWNCSVNQNRVANPSYNPNSDGGAKFNQGASCKSCTSERRWWWYNPSAGVFEDLDEATFQSYVNPGSPQYRGGSGWVKSCQE